MTAATPPFKAQAQELPGWLPWVLPLAVALLLRAALGYRPFPSIDDFFYIPQAWAAIDPGLFVRDDLLRGNGLHVPLWPVLVRALEATVGLAEGLWLLTLALSVGTVAAAWRLMRGLGVAGLTLPLAAVAAFAGRVQGVGRAQYDGAFGAAFHLQWLGLCLLLWVYDATLRRRAVPAGVLLGIAVIVHPVVAFHGAIAVGLATLMSGTGRWLRLTKTAVTCFLVGLPAIVPLTESMLSSGWAGDFDAAEVIEKGYLLRLPHEYTLDGLTPLVASMLAIMVAAGVAGLLALMSLRPGGSARPFAGLILGHLLLLGLFLLFAAPWVPEDWRHGTLLPIALHFSRTSSLLLALSVLAAVAALEAVIADRARGGDWPLWWFALGVALVTLLSVNVAWTAAAGAAAALGLLLPLARARPRIGAGLGILAAAAGAAAFGWVAVYDQREAPVPPSEAELYAWAAGTQREALFIVPPGMQGFRFYARRGVYGDFKGYMTIPNPSLVLEWRRRLDEVAMPDAFTLEMRGWDAVPFWDRSYANRNTPARIADLLTRTGADYFVWDAKALEVPPFAAVPRPPDARLTVSFANGRFTVYKLAKREPVT